MLLVRNISDSRGSLYIWLLILMIAFLPLMGLVVDISILYILKNKVQNALDAAGTSALSSSVILEAVQAGEGLKVERELAMHRFLHLLKLNLELTEDLKPRKSDHVFKGLELLTLEVQEENSPQLDAVVKVVYPTLILHYIDPEITLMVSSRSILETKN